MKQKHLWFTTLTFAALTYSAYAYASCGPTGVTSSYTHSTQHYADLYAYQECSGQRGPGQACVSYGCTEDRGQHTCTYALYQCN